MFRLRLMVSVLNSVEKDVKPANKTLTMHYVVQFAKEKRSINIRFLTISLMNLLQGKF